MYAQQCSIVKTLIAYQLHLYVMVYLTVQINKMRLVVKIYHVQDCWYAGLTDGVYMSIGSVMGKWTACTPLMMSSYAIKHAQKMWNVLVEL